METRARGLAHSGLTSQRGSHSARLSRAHEALAEGSRRTHQGSHRQLAFADSSLIAVLPPVHSSKTRCSAGRTAPGNSIGAFAIFNLLRILAMFVSFDAKILIRATIWPPPGWAAS